MMISRCARGLMLVLICSLLPVAQVWSFTLEQVRSYSFPEALVAAKHDAQVAWVVNDQGRRNIWVASGPDFVARQLTAYDQDDGQEVSSLLLTDDGSRIVYVRGGEHGGNWDRGLPVNVWSHPAGTKVEIWTMPVAGGQPVRLAEGHYPAVTSDGRAVAYIKDDAAWIVPTFQSTDGLTVHGQLFVPKKVKGKHPAVVYLHGGRQRQMLLGWHMMEYYSNDYAINQYLAHRGFVVLSVNYRLGPGYGFEFHFPPKAGPRGASEYQDVKAAGQYLQSLPEVDAERIGIYGGSYGGYLTAMGLAHDSGLFKVGVDIHGVHDWIMQYGLKDLLTRKHYQMPADAQQAIETGWSSSPVSAIASWKSPVLFITGDDDRNVRVTQTVDLWRRLRDTGVHQETLILVDETHSLHRHENVLRANRATVEFLERFLGEANKE